MQNPWLPAPSPPGNWISPRACVCGQRYNQYTAGVSFKDGVGFLWRAGNGQVLLSRGPVLWCMRVLKLSSWYDYHAYCGSVD